MSERWKRRCAILAGALLLLLLEAALLPSVPVWITDNGNKYMILRNLAEHGSNAVRNPASELDPENRFFPDGGFHFQRHDGKMFSVYPEVFSCLALPGYLLFGDAGLLLIPIAGTLAMLALFLALLDPLRLSFRIEALLAALLLCGTPFLFYSGTFWEMTVSAVFPLAALLASRRKRLFLAGLWLGLGVWLREEFYLIALVSGAAALVFHPRRWRECIPFGLGFLLCAVPLWLWNLHSYGHILGLHGALYYTHNAGTAAPTLAARAAGIIEGYFIYLFKFNSGNPETVWYYYLLLLPMLLLPIAGAFDSRRFKGAAAAAAVVSWAILLALYCENPEPAMASGLTVGFITASPLLAGFFLMWKKLLTRGALPVRMVTFAMLFYCVVLPPILTRSDIGIIWGPRHYLPVYPLLFLLSFLGFARLGWLSHRRRLLLAALISADLESDKAYIRGKISPAREFAVDGFYDFCLGPLREKWERIASYVPSAFSASDLKKFCAFLAGESRRRVYLRGNTVFGENFAPLRRSRLTGEEDMKTEIVLSDAGLVYCLGKVEDSVSDFLQKYYAERAIFS